MKKKIYVLDTNVLLSDPDALAAFDEHDVIVPLAVLEELDRQKTRPDDVGRNARAVSRTLDKMRLQGEGLMVGVPTQGGGMLRVVATAPDVLTLLPTELRDVNKTDNYLIALMRKLASNEEFDAIMVSKDINVRLKCDALGVKCEDYLRMRVADDPVKFYRGVSVVTVPASVVDSVYATGSIPVDVVHAQDQTGSPQPNQIVVLKHSDPAGSKRSVMTRRVGDDLRRIVDRGETFGLKPRNKEQRFALDLLMDPEIKLVTLVGPAGTGKTLLALAAGLEQLRGMGKSASDAGYQRLIVTRPVQPVGKEIGYLPGTLEEKMEPWISPIRDNLEQLIGSRQRPQGDRARGAKQEPYLSLLMESGKVEVEAITFIRGRSIPNSFMVIDEAQNLSIHELKTIVTRVGDGTKIILTGDIEQIDNVHVDIYTNGLTYCVERFKSHSIAGHVTLQKGERSPLATIASQIL